MKFNELSWAAFCFYYRSVGDQKYGKIMGDTSFISKLREAPSDISVSDYELNQFVNMMITIRQNRLGIKPGWVVGPKGNVVCECQVPKVYGNFAAHAVDIDHAREVFACFLSPLVKDKFVSRFDYDLAKLNHEISERTAVIEATLKERNRHIV